MGSKPFFKELLRKMSEAIVEQGPWGVLARGATADVSTGHQDAASLSRGRIEDEVGARRAIGVIAPVGEQLLAETFFGGRGEEPARDDLVGIDVGRGHHDRTGANGCDRVHEDLRISR
jgi:hypothetical protein